MAETIERIRSARLGNERSIWIRAPRDPRTATSLVVFLDAELYRDKVGAVGVLDVLGDAIADAWVVFVSAESAEARWVECPCHPPFAEFVVEELLPWLEARCEGVRAVKQRVLVGLSYTGLAAAFIAQSYPGVFQKVISQSGSFWWNDCWLTGQFAAMSGPVPTEFYLDVGTRETQTKVQHRADVLQVFSQIDGVRRFRDALLRLGHVVRYVEFEGNHECGAWGRALPGALKWALPR